MKKIVFLTGTRADFGKLKPLMIAVQKSNLFSIHIFATGMHLLPEFGVTAYEILQSGFDNVYLYNNVAAHKGMDIALANTISGFTYYISELKPDLIIVHGDRAEALAGAIVGSFNNIRVGHIEGGELSGSIDGLIRHSITKLAHAHFVTNALSRTRLLQMGEDQNSVFLMGSPEIDLMLSSNLKSIEDVKSHYDIIFDKFCLLIFHPVTNDLDVFQKRVKSVVDSAIESGLKYIIILPNNDSGSEIITNEYKRLENNPNFKIFPSLRFEYFLTLLKHTKIIIGNSSVGVREAPVYGIPSVNIGSRQDSRNNSPSIFNVTADQKEILKTIRYIIDSDLSFDKKYPFGNGKSSEKFMDVLEDKVIWNLPLQKQFIDLEDE